MYSSILSQLGFVSTNPQRISEWQIKIKIVLKMKENKVQRGTYLLICIRLP